MIFRGAYNFLERLAILVCGHVDDGVAVMASPEVGHNCGEHTCPVLLYSLAPNGDMRCARLCGSATDGRRPTTPLNTISLLLDVLWPACFTSNPFSSYSWGTQAVLRRMRMGHSKCRSCRRLRPYVLPTGISFHPQNKRQWSGAPSQWNWSGVQSPEGLFTQHGADPQNSNQTLRSLIAALITKTAVSSSTE